jgi:hypothetical protein
MLLSTEKNFLFIHIPKTGGSSINHLLYPYRNFEYSTTNHLTIENYKNWVDTGLFNSLFKFSFVRNPWDLQVSTWRYSVRNFGMTIDFKSYILWKFLDETNVLDYHKYVNLTEEDKIEEHIKNAFYINRVPQMYFLISENGKIMVDYIGNLETIESDMEYICNKLDIDLQFVPKINVSNVENESYQDYYDEETKKIVGDRFRLDCELFGYTFEETKKIKKIESPKGISVFDIIDDFKRSVIFNISNIIYGFADFKRKFENDEDYLNQKKDFDLDIHQRSIDMYKTNLEYIQQKIFELKVKISINPLDEDSINLLQKLILREISYMTQIRNFEELYEIYLIKNNLN